MPIRFIQDFFGLSSANAESASPTPNPSALSSSQPAPASSRPSIPFGCLDKDERRERIREINAAYYQDDIQEQKCSHDKKVSFYDGLITGYCEPAPAPFSLPQIDKNSSNIVVLKGPEPSFILTEYQKACIEQQRQPLETVEKQISYMHRTARVRQELLCLKGERLTFADLEALEAVLKLVQFDTLDFEYTFLEDDCVTLLCEYLEFYNSAIKLNLSFNRNIGLKGWMAVYEAIRCAPALQMINLRYSSIDPYFVLFTSALREFPYPALTCLHLENTNLSGENISHLMRALKSNTILKELFIGENDLLPGDALAIYDFIISNRSVQMLDLRNNTIGDYGFKYICDALKHQDTLVHSALSALVIWQNGITSSSMDNLAQALMINRHLETINIGSNILGLEGIICLKHALSGSSNLHRFGLQNTGMNCEAVIVLAECLADNDVIIRVDLRENPGIASAGFLALYSLMKMNSTITCLNIDKSCSNPTTNKVRPYQMEFKRYYDEIKSLCDKNREAALQKLTVRTTDSCKGDDASKSEDEHTDNEGKLDINNGEKDETKIKSKSRFYRSTSLTCQETITDIPERIRQMSGSTHSLDDTLKAEKIVPTSNANRFKVVNYGKLEKNEWGSLPAIPQKLNQHDEKTNESSSVVKKVRRFSVSPTASTFNVNPNSHVPSDNLTKRPHSLSISIPVTRSKEVGFSSAQQNSSLEQFESKAPIVSTPVPRINHLLELFKRQNAEEEPSSLVEKSDEERETNVKMVIADLINYIVYEENSQTERKISMLLGTPFTNTATSPIDTNSRNEKLEIKNGNENTNFATVSAPSTPSRCHFTTEELSGNNADEEVVQSVVRGMVREVLQLEKDLLRQTLEQRRKNSNSQPPCFLP